MLIGFDIGGTKCAVVIGQADGQIVDRSEFPTQASRGPRPIIDDLCSAADALIRKHNAAEAIGVSIGGPLDAARGVIHDPPNLPGWTALPLRSMLSDRFQLPVRVEHDAAACCLAEYRWGAGIGASRLIYLTCGTGFGAGMVFDGRVYRGANGRSVEIGHARLHDDGPTGFGKRGSVEAFCAASALGRIAAWRYPERWSVAPSSPDIVKLAAVGDDEAADVLAINALAVGDVCATLGDLLRPEVILLGSAARHFGAGWVAMVEKQFTAEALPETARACRICPAGLADRLQDCSALAVAADALGSPA